MILLDDYGIVESGDAEVLLNRQCDPCDWSTVDDAYFTGAISQNAVSGQLSR